MNKKITYALLCTVLASALAFSGCAQENSNGGTSSKEGYSALHPTFETAKDTSTGKDLYLISGGSSQYKIVIPEDASSTVTYAADFLQDTLKKATGATLQITTDEDVSYDRNEYVISLGDTSIVMGSAAAEQDYTMLNGNGFVLSLEGNSVIVNGASGLGTLYGVQEFLAYTVDYEVYTADVQYMNKSQTVKMPAFGTVVQAPSVKAVSLGARQAQNVDAAALYRSYDRYNYYDSLDGKLWDSVLIAHSIENIIPHSEYSYWYNDGQICYSQEDSYPVIAEYVANRIKASTTEIYFQLGNADTKACCSCDDCIDLAFENGGMGGAYIIWLNKIAALIEENLANDGYQDKEWYLLGLMYNAYEVAPVVYDATTQQYLPVNENVIANEHVGVQYAPISVCFAHAYDDKDCTTNVGLDVPHELFGWAAITDTYLIWSYNAEFTNFFFLYDDFGSMQDNIKLYSQLGVDCIYYQMSNNVNSPFEKFRAYLLSKWSWNAEIPYETLYNEFFNGYYREAAPYMMQYFEAIRAHIAMTSQQLGDDGCYVYGYKSLTGSMYWSYNLLQSYEQILDKAYAALKEAGYTSSEYEEMRLRVRADEMFCTNYLYRNYQLYYTTEEYWALEQAYYKDNATLNNTRYNESLSILEG